MSSINLIGKRKAIIDNDDEIKKLIDNALKKENDLESFRNHGQTDVLTLVNEEKTNDVAASTPPDTNKKFDHFFDPNKAKSKPVSNPEKKSDDKEKPKKDSTEKSKATDKAVAMTEIPLKKCSVRGKNLVGPLFIEQRMPSETDLNTISIDFGGTVRNGGWWSPTDCAPRMRVAVIIPFRKREEQLKIFLHHLHPVLQRQQLFYRIIVVEQLADDPFNRAGLFNVGFAEALKISPFNCFIFTDVDLLPEDDRNYYGCPTSPRHMSVAVDKFEYRLPYATIFGGVGAFTKKHFEEINGMSNLFWGWGGEDDDLYKRISSVGLKLTRPSMLLGRYTMIRRAHFQSSKADPNRMNLLRNSDDRMTVDGLNTLKYDLKEVVEEKLVTIVKIRMKKKDYFQ